MKITSFVNQKLEFLIKLERVKSIIKSNRRDLKIFKLNRKRKLPTLGNFVSAERINKKKSIMKTNNRKFNIAKANRSVKSYKYLTSKEKS